MVNFCDLCHNLFQIKIFNGHPLFPVLQQMIGKRELANISRGTSENHYLTTRWRSSKLQQNQGLDKSVQGLTRACTMPNIIAIHLLIVVMVTKNKQTIATSNTASAKLRQLCSRSNWLTCSCRGVFGPLARPGSHLCDLDSIFQQTEEEGWARQRRYPRSCRRHQRGRMGGGVLWVKPTLAHDQGAVAGLGTKGGQ